MTEPFLFTIYSRKELPKTLRESFQLPKYTFKKEGETYPPKVTKEFFDKYSIIHYRDELNSLGILLSNSELRGVPAYRTCGALNYRGMKISQWSPREDIIKYNKIVTKYGDDYAWLQWNYPVIILEISDNEIRLA